MMTGLQCGGDCEVVTIISSPHTQSLPNPGLKTVPDHLGQERNNVTTYVQLTVQCRQGKFDINNYKVDYLEIPTSIAQSVISPLISIESVSIIYVITKMGRECLLPLTNKSVSCWRPYEWNNIIFPSWSFGHTECLHTSLFFRDFQIRL